MCWMNKARVIVISKVATAMDWIVRYQQASRGLVTIDSVKELSP